MSAIERKTPIQEIRMRIALCSVLIMLSIDSINPVKVLCSMVYISTTWIAIFAFLMMTVVFYSNAKELAYFSTKIFFHSILSTFLSSMEVLGKENIPLHGPVIFTANHMNQFVDGAVLLVTNPHHLRFLVAESSYKKRIIGDFCKAIGSIPVCRPQDNARKGIGKVKFDGYRIIGENTLFTKIDKKERLRPGRSSEMYRIKTVISDTEGFLSDDRGEPVPLNETKCQFDFVDYEIIGVTDQSAVYSASHESLSQGNCLGIFPEGGSHDNTDLLPLKAGIASIVFGVLDKYDINVPIIPVGLNYFKGHRFRGRVVVEYGKPIYVSKALSQLYKDSKRDAFLELLTNVEDGMRSVIVAASDYSELRLIHTVRRLYQRATVMSTEEKQDLARRFAVAYRLLKDRYGSIDSFPDDLKELKDKIVAYDKCLSEWGLKDYQINNLDTEYSKLLYKFVHGATIMFLASIPSLLLNAPVGFAASYWAKEEAKKDLVKSRVKIDAKDVLLSKKIVFTIYAVPLLWITYALLLCFFSPLEKKTIVVLFLCCPIFSYSGVMAVEAGMVDIKDLRPLFLRLLPSFHEIRSVLPKTRSSLVYEVRNMTRKYGPELGSLYFEKSRAWEKSIKRQSNQSSEDLYEMVNKQDASSIVTEVNINKKDK